MDIRSALIWGHQKLNDKTPSATLDAEVLLAMAIKKTKECLFAHPEQVLTKKQLAIFCTAVRRRVQGWPVAYLTGHQEFYGLDFFVTPAVLIPRPETELIIDSVLSAKQPQTTNIADIGTGSGCIAVTLAKRLPLALILATDISQKALTVAKKNAKKHQVKIKFSKGDLLLSVIKNKKWSESNQTWIITANLPYLTKEQLTEPSIKKEPRLALFGGPNGLKYYQTLLQQLRANVIENNQYQLFLEIGPRQKNQLTKLVKKLFPTAKIEIKNDFAKQNRLLIFKILN